MGAYLKFKFLEKLFGARSFVEPEKLTDERAREILGRYANHVVMYNFDTKKWNRNFYLGYRVMSAGVDCVRMCREVERANSHIDVAAVVGIVAEQGAIKMFQVLPKPAIIHYENPIAYATFITRDRKTGKLNELPQKWIQLSECTHPAYLCEAMPQLLSGIGYSSAPMWQVEWCLDGAKMTDSLISAKQREKCYKRVRREFRRSFRKR